MGHQKLEIDIYSCHECGWIGIDPRDVKVKDLQPDEMGRIKTGSRGGRVVHRLECPVCRKPIRASFPIELQQMNTVDPRKKRLDLPTAKQAEEPKSAWSPTARYEPGDKVVIDGVVQTISREILGPMAEAQYDDPNDPDVHFSSDTGPVVESTVEAGTEEEPTDPAENPSAPEEANTASEEE